MTKYEHGVEWLLTGEPRPSQIEAIARSYYGFRYRDHRYDDPHPIALQHAGRPAHGFGLFMEMRLGKTPTFLNEFMLMKRDYGVKKALVLAPNQYKGTWGLEANKFGVDVPHHVFESRDRGDAENFIRKQSEGLLIVNYEALTSQKTRDLLAEWVDKDTLMGADESVKIKGSGVLFKSALTLGRMARATRPMTGKPAPQSPLDYYSQLKFARQLDGVIRHAFKARHCLMGGFKNKQIVGIRNEEQLSNLLETSSFVARRKDWADKIDSDYEMVSLKLDTRQLEAYHDMERDFMTWVTDNQFVAVEQAANRHQKLQQISSGWIYDSDKNAHILVPFEKTAKFKDLVERIEEKVTDKVIIFYYYQATGEMLFEALKKYNPTVIAKTQVMRKLGRNIDSEKARFNNDPNSRVMLGQVTSIKYGHTLMGTPDNPCLDEIYFENSFSLDDRAQTEDRAQGSGQLAPINIVDYVSTPVEKRIINALKFKDNISNAILDYYRNNK